MTFDMLVVQLKSITSLSRSLLLETVSTHLSLASFLWDMGKQYSPRCDAPSGDFLIA